MNKLAAARALSAFPMRREQVGFGWGGVQISLVKRTETFLETDLGGMA